jgi:dTDP-4-amino-4,6-dideoxygalactose transaminase
MKVPFLDLVTPHLDLEERLVCAFRNALRTAAFSGGPVVDSFEREFADYCSSRYCVGVANGTDALRFALIAAGVRHGDVVVTVPNTFIATAEAISQAGARPAFVDVDERTYTMAPDALREYFESACVREGSTKRLVHRDTGAPVTAVVPVHLYGQMVDMDPVLELAERYNLLVIEDACQAHGAEYFSRRERRWRVAGSIGHAAAFSFYPGKNLGACGEAGAITTQDETIARECRMLRDHGQSRKYYHEIEGYNGRLDAIQAGFLSVKLQHLPEWTEQRRRCARVYDEMFAGADERLVTPYVPDFSRPVFHLYVVRVCERERLIHELQEAGIGTGIHYPVSLHLSCAYRHLAYQPGDFPVAERLANEVLSLPMFPTLSREAQQMVASEVLRRTENVCSPASTSRSSASA